MQGRTSGVDGFRISVSSTPSCSSHGSGPDELESLGDVYVWGEVWCDGASSDGNVHTLPRKTDILTPKLLESHVVLDVHQIACGSGYVALVTRQGELFTWGEEYGGRLGHGIEKDFGRPRLVDYLAFSSVESVACGKYHTCAITSSGDLYTWGDGAYNAGLLGHGTDVSHWMPKRVSGPLEGFKVLSVACGTWHSALVMSDGRLFTFGDGAFGVLGHGDRESVCYPREVRSLSGFRTVKVACGVWHSAAIVEVISNQYGTSVSPKCFTWGDGDKYRLGHGNKETYLIPTIVSALVDYSFHQLGCGLFLTVVLTTSGHVFTMGSPAYGQLGNPQSDGKLPCLVQDSLVGEFVEEIACGAYHVSVLTSRSEVYTWGMGSNGRLGHGDFDDRETPTLVEALKDRYVKRLSCGLNYTYAICGHKFMSGEDQTVCSSCRQAFGFTRKRHNCYNCGLVHCHSCSSKKALRAALAPTPGKPHRVCDACFVKLKKAAEIGNNASTFNRRMTTQQLTLEARDRFDRAARASRVLFSPSIEPVKYHEVKVANPRTKGDSYSIVRASQVPSFQQLKDISFPSSLSAFQFSLKPVITTVLQPQPQTETSSMRPASPVFSRGQSPPRSSTPVFSRGVIGSLKKTNELLTQEVTKLQNQVKSLRQKSDLQDAEIKNLRSCVQESASLSAGKSTKSNVALEALKCITSQLNEFTHKLPTGISESESLKAIQDKANSFLDSLLTGGPEPHCSLPSDSVSVQHYSPEGTPLRGSTNGQYHKIDDHVDVQNSALQEMNGSSSPENLGVMSQDGTETSSRSPNYAKREGLKEVYEQFEPGVYVALVQLASGNKIFKRVKFSKRRFSEQKAEEWWKENGPRVLRKYGEVKANSTPAEPSDTPQSAEENKDETPSSA